MISEIRLFKDKIKPGIFLSKNMVIKNKIDIDDFYSIKINDSILLTHSPMPEKFNQIGLGKLLGYYPKSCDLFLTDRCSERVEFLNFNGIHFNTKLLYDEALEWCIEQYGKSMLEKYKKIEYCKELMILNPNQKKYILSNEKVHTIKKL